MKDLLSDPRYAAYIQLLTEAKEAFEQSRHDLLNSDDPPPDRDDEVMRLTGKIELTNHILLMPDKFMALLEKNQTPDGNGREHSQTHEVAP